jgi:hypothetical protein
LPGRHKWAPTQAQRRTAKRLARCGLGERAIATHIGVARGTLRAALGQEIAQTRTRLRVRLVERVLRDALQFGNARDVRIMLGLLAAGAEQDANDRTAKKAQPAKPKDDSK